MTTLSLTESYVTTIVNALMHHDTYASRAAVRELERQGIKLGAWVQRDLHQREIVAADRTARLNALHTGTYAAGE